MQKRPTSITVIAWFLILSGGIGLLAGAFTMNSPQVVEIMKLTPVPIPVQFAIMFVGSIVYVVTGLGLLKGKNWARYLYAALGIIYAVYGLATSPMKLMLIPGILLMAVVAYFLFRSQANAYFMPQSIESIPDFIINEPEISYQPEDSSRKPGSTAKAIGVVLYIVSGFFIYGTILLSFINFEAVAKRDSGSADGAKLFIICVFGVLALVPLLTGAAVTRFYNWKREIGITLLSGAGFGTVMFIMFEIMLSSPENARLFPKEMNLSSFFSDYTTGLMTIALIAGLGMIMFISGKKRPRPTII